MAIGDFMVRVEKSPTISNPVKIIETKDLTAVSAEELKPPVDVPANVSVTEPSIEDHPLVAETAPTPAPAAPTNATPWRDSPHYGKAPKTEEPDTLPATVKPPVIELNLKYSYEGMCTYCKDTPVETIELEDVISVKRKFQKEDQGKTVSSKVVVVAWCPKCRRKVRQRQVHKL